jgi:hypothetical protein
MIEEYSLALTFGDTMMEQKCSILIGTIKATSLTEEWAKSSYV